VRSPQNKSVHYRLRINIWLSKCTSVQISNSTKVSAQNVFRVLECKLEDVDATAWSLHQWTSGGNLPTLRSGVTSAGQRHEPGCDTHGPAAFPKSGSLLGSVQDCWLATELERWSLVFHKLTAARPHAPCGQERCLVKSNEVASYWKPKYLVIAV